MADFAATCTMMAAAHKIWAATCAILALTWFCHLSICLGWKKWKMTPADPPPYYGIFHNFLKKNFLNPSLSKKLSKKKARKGTYFYFSLKKLQC